MGSDTMIRRFKAVLVVALAVGLLATSVGTGAVAAQDQSATETVQETVERDSVSEVNQEEIDESEEIAVTGDLSDVFEDAPTDSPEESEEPDEPDAPTELPEDPFGDVPDWLLELFS